MNPKIKNMMFILNKKFKKIHISIDDLMSARSEIDLIHIFSLYPSIVCGRASWFPRTQKIIGDIELDKFFSYQGF